jgi:hypothetical protein
MTSGLIGIKRKKYKNRSDVASFLVTPDCFSFHKTRIKLSYRNNNCKLLHQNAVSMWTAFVCRVVVN